MWIGGWLAVTVLAGSLRGESQELRTRLTALLAGVQTRIIGPGALLTIGSGIVWSMAIVPTGSLEIRVAPVGLWTMTAAGMIGGILVLAVALPTAARLKAIAVTGTDGQTLPAFGQLKSKLMVVSYVAGACALVALFAAVIAP
jgi:hypothetical protein